MPLYIVHPLFLAPYAGPENNIFALDQQKEPIGKWSLKPFFH